MENNKTLYFMDDQIIIDEYADINTPAIAAAYVVKTYCAQESDEISFEVGDIISVIEIPSPEESVWWKGKRGFKVGFFPSDCVEVIGRRGSLFSNQLNTSIHSLKEEPQVLHDRSNVATFFRSFVLHRPRRKVNQKGSNRDKVFGCDLREHLMNICRDIPLVLKCCAEFIETHGIVDGIYRLSGVKSNISKLRQSFDQGRIPDLETEAILQDIHCVASLLKMYFRELPNPLLTYQLYESFVKAIQPNLGEENSNNIPDSVKLSNLRAVISQLPSSHYRTLEYLLRHLSKIASHGSETGMTPKNVAIVWAPNLLRSKDLESGGASALQFIGIQAVLTEYLIRYVDVLFTKDYYNNCPPKMSSLRPKSLPVSSSRLLSLEEARGRWGISEGLCSDQDRLDRKFHTVIDLRKRGVNGQMKKIRFRIGYLHNRF